MPHMTDFRKSKTTQYDRTKTPFLNSGETPEFDFQIFGPEKFHFSAKKNFIIFFNEKFFFSIKIFFIDFFILLVQKMDFHENDKILWNYLIQKLIKITKNDDFYIKIIDFDQYSKKNDIVTDPWSVVSMSPAARCAGANWRRKYVENIEKTSEIFNFGENRKTSDVRHISYYDYT